MVSSGQEVTDGEMAAGGDVQLCYLSVYVAGSAACEEALRGLK